MVKLTIDQQIVEVPDHFSVLMAAKQLGIDIPTLCYDERLTPHAACRMCVVELGNGKIVTACSTPVSEGMEVQTESAEVVNARKGILELILANHPLDCLTCETAGQCKLQDYCYRYDVKGSSYKGDLKEPHVDDSNPFYISDQAKCIDCGLCVRVCNELQMTSAIDFANRGFDTYISPSFGLTLDESPCVSCGNCVAVCPVGALMPKSKTKFRSWEVQKVRTTCAYCGVGCQLDLLVKGNKVVGIEPANGPSNEGLLCVKGRFAFNFLGHPNRLKTPLIRKGDQLVEATWAEAYALIAQKTNEIKQKFGPDAIGGFSSARCTNEENYLFQKMMRAAVGTNNVDHCARL